MEDLVATTRSEVVALAIAVLQIAAAFFAFSEAGLVIAVDFGLDF
jgi:hypothetical protein